jgi:hypothetical protein
MPSVEELEFSIRLVLLRSRVTCARLKSVLAPFMEIEKKEGLPEGTISRWMIPFKMERFGPRPKAALAGPRPAIIHLPMVKECEFELL